MEKENNEQKEQKDNKNNTIEENAKREDDIIATYEWFLGHGNDIDKYSFKIALVIFIIGIIAIIIGILYIGIPLIIIDFLIYGMLLELSYHLKWKSYVLKLL